MGCCDHNNHSVLALPPHTHMRYGKRYRMYRVFSLLADICVVKQQWQKRMLMLSAPSDVLPWSVCLQHPGAFRCARLHGGYATPCWLT